MGDGSEDRGGADLLWMLLPGGLAASSLALFLVDCAAHDPRTMATAHIAPVAGWAPLAEPEAEPEPDLVVVAVPREFRGLWVATVFNLDFPSRAGLSAEAGQAELVHLVEGASEAGINALIFQVRPEGDALYASEIEPWSRYLTGHQGGDPGYDPLGVLVDEAHRRGIEVHAWFNPYRAAANRRDARHAGHISRVASAAVRNWGNTLWLDPGVAQVQDAAINVIDDVVSRYDIDGVHIDDYFYPYPDGRNSFPDWNTYQAYRDQGGALSRPDWRRGNVDGLVERINDVVEARCPACRLGISPFGLYRPGQPPGSRGLDQVAALHADPLLWYGRNWADYLAPQLYWSTQKRGQRYDQLLTWWDGQVTPERPLLVGLDATKVGRSAEWSLAEIRTQVRLAREAPSTLGQIWFRAAPVLTNQAGLKNLMATELYAAPAVPPPTPGLTPPAPPVIVVQGHLARLTHPDPDRLRSYALYGGDELVFDRLLVPGTTEIPLAPGTWAVSAIVRGAMESPAVRIRIAPGPEAPG